jgi:glutathione S-transferase
MPEQHTGGGATQTVEIIGRSSSHFTRMARIFAEELRVPYRLVPVPDMTVLSDQAYAGNPATKLPVLRMGDSTLFGAQSICRALAEHSSDAARIVWPEDLRDPLSRNAQELVWHAMAVQVQLAFGILICRLPADNVYFVKAREGFNGSLLWLDAQLADVCRLLPPARTLSVFEVSLFCLVDHLTFRPTVPIAPYRALGSFAQEFAQRSSARRTPYRFDA